MFERAGVPGDVAADHGVETCGGSLRAHLTGQAVGRQAGKNRANEHAMLAALQFAHRVSWQREQATSSRKAGGSA